MILLDTSALVALLVESDEHHNAMRALAQTTEEVRIPHVILIETLIVLYRLTKDHVATSKTAHELTSRFSLLCANPESTLDAVNLYSRYGPKLGIFDCELISLNKHFQSNVITFDEELKKYLVNYPPEKPF